VPLVLQSSGLIDLSGATNESLANDGSSSHPNAAVPGTTTGPLNLAVIDMNKAFSSYYKTKDAETRINEARTSAKKELDDRLEIYKKHPTKELEKEINEFRTTREKQLQDQAVRMRNDIVDEIATVLKKLCSEEQYNLVLDCSGQSQGGVPVVFWTNKVPALTERVYSQLNKTSLPPLDPPCLQPKLAMIDIERILKACPQTKVDEGAINKARGEAKAKVSNETERKKEEDQLQELAKQKRDAIIKYFTPSVEKYAASRGFNIIIDSSGNSLNGVGFVQTNHGIPEITDEILVDLKQK
jgi:outer membrane protein